MSSTAGERQTSLRSRGPRRASGSALAICLIFLLLVTILGMSVIKTTTLQDKMAANTRDKDLAFQAAEAALKAAEAVLSSKPYSVADFSADCDGGLCAMPAAGAAVRWEDPNICGSGKPIWSCAKSSAVSDKVDAKIHAQQPRYFVELLDLIDTRDDLNMVNIGEAILGDIIGIFRVTAIGYGGSANATVVLQTTFATDQINL